jgi:very-short-patch-repair endonuclease
MELILATIAAAQCGVFSRVQARAAGYSEARIRQLLAVGTWVQCRRGIYCLAGMPISFGVNVWIAVLAAGPDALLSFRIAGKLYRFEGTPPPVRFDLSVPPGRHPQNVPRARIHRTELTPDDVATYRGFPVTSVVRTLIDLASSLPLDVGPRVIGDALRTGRTSVASIERRIGGMAGHVGIERARRALASADPRLESVLEGELLALLRRAGLNPIAQFVVTAGGAFVARVDFALPGIRLAIESDGYDSHTRRPGFERDREKSALLQLAGWQLLSFTATQIRQRPEWVIETVLKRVQQLTAAA